MILLRCSVFKIHLQIGEFVIEHAEHGHVILQAGDKVFLFEKGTVWMRRIEADRCEYAFTHCVRIGSRGRIAALCDREIEDAMSALERTHRQAFLQNKRTHAKNIDLEIALALSLLWTQTYIVVVDFIVRRCGSTTTSLYGVQLTTIAETR